jgi:hypothetical protein
MECGIAIDLARFTTRVEELFRGYDPEQPSKSRALGEQLITIFSGMVDSMHGQMSCPQAAFMLNWSIGGLTRLNEAERFQLNQFWRRNLPEIIIAMSEDEITATYVLQHYRIQYT